MVNAIRGAPLALLEAIYAHLGTESQSPARVGKVSNEKHVMGLSLSTTSFASSAFERVGR